MGKTKKEDQEVKKVLLEFMSAQNLKQAEVARIIGCDPSAISWATRGLRPYGPVLARLYILTQDEAFAPQDEREKEALNKELSNPVEALNEYLTNGSLPRPVQETKAAKTKKIRIHPASPPVNTPVQPPLDPSPVPSPSTPPADSDEAPPDDVITSPWVHGVMAGMTEIKGQTFEGLRFVITRGSFRKVRTTFTDEEIQDTMWLIQELRRRFNLVSQMENNQDRARIGRALAREVDELFLAITLAKKAIPSNAAEQLMAVRAMFKQRKPTDND